MRRFVQAFDGASQVPGLPDALWQTLSCAPARYNLGGQDEAWVILERDGVLVVERFIWGLIPRWSKARKTAYTTVTARLDRASKSRIFSGPWRERHCIVPISGYYKWNRTVKPPTPYFVEDCGGELLLLAGLWEQWEREEPAICSFAVLTRPNEAIPPPLTPDGPVFVSHSDWLTWCSSPTVLDTRFLNRQPTPRLCPYEVARVVANRKLDDYTLLEPLAAATYLDASAGEHFDEQDDEG